MAEATSSHVDLDLRKFGDPKGYQDALLTFFPIDL